MSTAPLETANVYGEINPEGRARALAKCDVTDGPTPTKRVDADVMQFLRSL